MSEELAHYRPTPLELQRTTTDDWFDVFPSIIKLAEYVSDTEFVPDAMRRRPAAVAAAVLTGRELGLPPMVALRHLFVVKGKVGQSAELMRALVLRAGHEIRYVESTDHRCIVEGRRKDDNDWTRVQFTTDDAKRAGIDTRGYAADKLVARATSRLCRRIFADAVMGLPAVDELEDYGDADVVELAPADTEPVQRKRRTRKPKAAATQPAAASAAQPDDDVAELLGDEDEPGQDGGNDLSQGAEPSSGANVDIDSRDQDNPIADAIEDVETDDEADLLADLQPVEMITPAQRTKVLTLLGKEKITKRDERLAWLSSAVGRDVGSTDDLTKQEASTVIDILENPTEP
jgi:hypothetical protein